MKSLFFNELSVYPLANDFTEAYQKIGNFYRTYKARPENLFDRRITLDDHIENIQISRQMNFREFIMNPRARIFRDILYGTTRRPFFLEGSQEESKYLQNKYLIRHNHEDKECYGLAAAYLHDSVGIGFASDAVWENLVHSIIVKSEFSGQSSDNILCVSKPEHFSSENFKKWENEHTELELVETDLLPLQKHINLRDDHGKDILHKFSKRLVNSRYIESVINSLPFKPKEKKFIRDITFDDQKGGLIEIVLTDTDSGFGLVAKTTGRNLKETQKIAELVERRYG